MIVASHIGSGSSGIARIFKEAKIDAKIVWVKTPAEAKRLHFKRLLLLGGTDIDPSYYHQKCRYAYPGDAMRDATEWVLARRALMEDIPTLGICRGHQMLTIAAGGSLHQDMVFDGAVRRGYDHDEYHEIETYDDLWWLPNWVNSYHHQAAVRAPKGFKTAAVALDGVIEAIYKPGFLGVQWHPEMLWQTDPNWLSLFEWFHCGLQ